MSQEELFINGDLLRLRREARGWVLSDMATRACMSVKQVRQLEEGGMSSFYSVAVKATAAKKVGALLGITPEEVFGQVAEAQEVVSESVHEEIEHSPQPEPVVEIVASQDVAEIQDEPAAENVVSEDVASHPEQEKSKMSVWVIAGLFAAALAVAAYMQPQEEPVVEAAPPLQVVPAEASDAASASEVSASSASAAAEAAMAALGQKTIMPVAASAPTTVASVIRAPSVVSSAATIAARPASGSVAATPAASSASKAP